ncbi:hypothetical protein [Hydrogenimonas urashimensis]|uniref:hypothetical protein n=1 Tax=Hydrogenimonas urashimensis TaxID=2740515 RepID=UPI0019150240|nr:hypothetical protein [Hydrogenimonas urashimensis]
MYKWAMMALVLFSLNLQADRIRSTTIACSDTKTLQKVLSEVGEYKKRNLQLMQMGCKVLSPDDKIHILEPDSNCCGIFYRIQVEKSNDIMYVRKLDVIVEQAGTGNILKF